MALDSAEGTDKEELIMRSGRKGVQRISGDAPATFPNQQALDGLARMLARLMAGTEAGL